jgi:thiol reductant ABC exporter CydC subunit
MRRLVAEAGGWPARRLLPAAVGGVLSAACGVGLLATSGWLITRASEKPPVLALSIAIGAVQAFSLGRGLARYFQRLGVHRASLAVLGKLREHLFDLLEPRAPGVVNAGSALAAFVSDTEIVADGLAKGFMVGTDVLASIVLGAALAAAVEPSLGVVVLAGALAVVTVAWVLARLGVAAEARAAEQRAELARFVVETTRAARELVAYGREDLVRQRLDEARRRSRTSTLSQAAATGLARAGATVVAGMGLIAVIGTGLALHSAGHLAGVALAAVGLATLAVLDQCANVPAALAAAAAGTAASRRTRRLGALPVPTDEPPEGKRPVPADEPPAALKGVAALEGASVTWPGGTWALDRVSLWLGPGGRLALMGPSGAGKTSAIYALLHFVTCSEGRARLGGSDVASLTRGQIADLAGWLAGETYLFAASLGDNLRLGRPGATDADCRSALARAGLADWYASLPEGLGTRLGEGGRPVSAGERQRLGMARVLVSGAPLLLLDEPTAHLDPGTSSAVLAELLGAASGRSVLVVSHEPSIVEQVDTVVVLDGGRVRSGGPGSQKGP